MKRIRQKKLSGAESRKRRKMHDTECAKSSELLTAFLKSKTSDVEPGELKQIQDVTTEHNDMEQERTEKLNSSRSESENETNLNETEHQNLSKSEDSNDNTTEQIRLLTDVIHHRDFGYLKFDQTTGKAMISDALRLELVEKGSIYFQNSAGPFAQTNNRSITSSWFTKKLGKGEGGIVNRSWLLYSPLKCAAFCFPCLLFPSVGSPKNCSSLEKEVGFNHWKKTEKMTMHENSVRHRISFRTWKEMEMKIIKKVGFIDDQLQKQIDTDKEKWRQVLKRLLCCIKYLAKQNLALRGHRESIVETHKNPGNFLELLKFMAEFDPVIKNHLMYAQQNPRSVTYISPTTQNEFIQYLAVSVREKLLLGIQDAKYYGIMFDSTPDNAHNEQISEIVRYVNINFKNKTVTIEETFLGFIQTYKKDAASIADIILEQLDKDKLSFKDCRSQCYDNASVMSGYKSGVQQRLATINPKAIFVNCDNHTLNLVGVHAASQEVEAVTFFGTIQSTYVYFSRSTLRWDKLKNALGVSVKSESETRWSARAEAVKPIYNHHNKLIELLENMAEDHNENADTRGDANRLLHGLLKYEFFVLLQFWNIVLAKIDRVQKRLQDHTINFHNAAQDIRALDEYFLQERNVLCTKSTEEAKKLCDYYDVQVYRRQRKKKKMPGEMSEDVALTAESEIIRVMKSVLDKIHTELKDRFNNLFKLDSSFGFLLDINSLMGTSTNNETLKQKCDNFGNFYDSDLDALELFNEIIDCRMLLNARCDVHLSTPQDLLHFIVQYGEDVFPNLRVGLQILLTICTSIASCERSFSKLKLIKSYLRSSMAQDRLSALALLSIERETTDSIDFDKVIEKFAAIKARKICF